MPGYDFNASGPAFVRFTNSAHWHDEDRFLRSLACAEATSRDPLDASAVASGAFAELPAELVDAICIELLKGSSENRGQPRTTRHYASFLLACRWVRASVSRRVALEAKCIHLVHKCHSLPALPVGASYVDYAKTAIRSRIELDMLYRYIKGVSFHCADPTAECCRGLRAALNDDWNQTLATAPFPIDSLGAEALCSRAGKRATVVAPTRARLLCATPDGVLLCDDERVWSVTSKPAEEFAPGYELATAFSTSRKSKVGRVWGAARGKRIAVCEFLAHWSYTAGAPTGKPSLFSLRIFEDDRLIAETEMDERNASHMEAREPHSMWIHNGAVWLLWYHRDGDGSYAQLMRVHPHEMHTPESEWLTTTYKYENVFSMSVATDAGHVALFYADASGVGLFFFDVDTLSGRYVTVINLSPNSDYLWNSYSHQITLSPDGTRMVLLAMVVGKPMAIPYVRDHKPESYEHHGWREIAPCVVPEAAERAFKRGLFRHAVFTPCGRRFLAFSAGLDGATGVLEIQIMGLMDGEIHKSVVDYCRFTTVRGATDLPGKAIWSNDGLFVQTYSDVGGVLRLGLVA